MTAELIRPETPDVAPTAGGPPIPEPATERTAVDRLLDSEDFVRTATGWAADWFELPRPSDDEPRFRDRNEGMRRRLETTVADDASWRDTIADLLDVGRPILARFPDARDRAEFVGRSTLGIRLGCARCHDHPGDRWTRDDHQGFAALFVDPRPAPDRGMQAGVLFDDRDGEPVRPSLTPVVTADALPVPVE